MESHCMLLLPVAKQACSLSVGAPHLLVVVGHGQREVEEDLHGREHHLAVQIQSDLSAIALVLQNYKTTSNLTV